MRTIRWLSVAVLLLVGLPGVAQAQSLAPLDYSQVQGLSQPTYQTRRDTTTVTASDGTALYVEIVRPDAPGRFPVILEASPYHGTLADRDGTRILPGPVSGGRKIGLTGYFAPRGYAVVMMDLRGTGRSSGCLDHLSSKDASDLKRIVEWTADAEWSNGRVGMTGHSYVGSTPSVAAAQNPRGLVTIVPSAGLASMYDHQFQGGVPFWLQWAGPMYAYEGLAIDRKGPPGRGDPVTGAPMGDDFGNNPADTGCGLPSSSLTSGESQLSGVYSPWHAARDWSAGATASNASVFAVHGVNDDAARVTALQWFHNRNGRPGDKLWLGQWNHGSGCCPNRRGNQWTAALHAWFDHELQQRPVATGPPVEVFLSDASTLSAAQSGARSEVLTGPAWPLQSTSLDLSAASDGKLQAAAPSDGSVTFSAVDPGFFTSGAGATFRSPIATTDSVFAGVPQLDLVASVTVERVHLIATLYDENSSGTQRRITQFAINPELRDGLDRITPIVPGTPMRLRPPGFAIAHHLRPGHRLVLRVTTTDDDKVPTFAVDPQIKIFTGATGTTLHLPLVTSTGVYPDNFPL